MGRLPENTAKSNLKRCLQTHNQSVTKRHRAERNKNNTGKATRKVDLYLSFFYISRGHHVTEPTKDFLNDNKILTIYSRLNGKIICMLPLFFFQQFLFNLTSLVYQKVTN